MACGSTNRHNIRVRLRSRFGDMTLARQPKHGLEDLITVHVVVDAPSDPSMPGTDVALSGFPRRACRHKRHPDLDKDAHQRGRHGRNSRLLGCRCLHDRHRRDQLRSIEAYAATLLHEVSHARSDAQDVTTEFEDALTTTLGSVGRAALTR
jgi:hypothetical protein